MFKGYREHMVLQRVKAIPPELLAQLSETGKCDLVRWTSTLPSMLRFSKETWYVQYQSKPLLAIGAVQLSFLDPSREMFMYGSRHLHWTMLPTLREMFTEWLSLESGPIYARAVNPVGGKYMRFFGFILSHIDADGIEVYEVRT